MIQKFENSDYRASPIGSPHFSSDHRGIVMDEWMKYKNTGLLDENWEKYYEKIPT